MATFPLAILGTLLGVACAGDVAQRRIPNAVVGAVALAGLAFQWTAGGAVGGCWRRRRRRPGLRGCSSCPGASGSSAAGT